jgi:protein arginine kinase activator
VKCQRCEKPATFHITELTEPTGPREIHLCEDCARYYLQHGSVSEPKSAQVEGLGGHSFKMAQTAEELAQLDQRTCPICGISFYEFRQIGRLGCPHDYVCFERELEPLLANIHGRTRHVGKTPKRGSATTDEQTRVIRLRREMQEAVQREDYELASQLRDEIKKLENLH